MSERGSVLVFLPGEFHFVLFFNTVRTCFLTGEKCQPFLLQIMSPDSQKLWAINELLNYLEKGKENKKE